jgi:hypothetical protein
MILLLKFLFFGHVHKWKVLERREMINEDNFKRGVDFILQCEKCGDVKRRKCRS